MIQLNWQQEATQRERLLFGAILVLLMFFFLRVVYVAKGSAIKETQARVEALLMERNALQRFLEKTPSLSHLTPNAASEDVKLKVFSGEVSSAYAGLPALLPHLMDPGLLEGAQMEAFSFQTPVTESGFVHTDFVLEVSGSFGELIKYLEKLETFPALFQVRDIVFSLHEGKGTEVKAEITCRFFKKAETTPGNS